MRTEVYTGRAIFTSSDIGLMNVVHVVMNKGYNVPCMIKGEGCVFERSDGSRDIAILNYEKDKNGDFSGELIFVREGVVA